MQGALGQCSNRRRVSNKRRGFEVCVQAFIRSFTVLYLGGSAMTAANNDGHMTYNDGHNSDKHKNDGHKQLWP